VGTIESQPATGPAGRKARSLTRLLTLLVAAVVFGFALRQAGAHLDQRTTPAGLLQGMVQGAMMPCTLPTLLLGYDVVIYASHNAGVPYKLGYTLGVNLCGALFFGSVYWRWNRWRKPKP
jgi:hypothetical protein